MSHKSLRRLLRFWFADGWFFIVPFLFAYLIGYVAKIPVTTLRIAFLGLAGVTGIGLALFLGDRLKRAFRHPGHLWLVAFWATIWLVVYLPGAYLEFPSDPWEHLARTANWGSLSFVGDHLQWKKFVYFFNWCFLHSFLPDRAKGVLDLLGAFWETLFLYQVFLFARRLGGSTKWALVQVVGTLFLFGSTAFNIRYYALSTTPLAYVAYLRLVIILKEFAGKRFNSAWAIPLLIAVIAFNHLQELFLAGVSALVILSWVILRGPRQKLKIAFVSTMVAIFVASFGFGYYMVNYRLGTYYTRPWFFLITTYGGLKFPPPALRFYDTYGVHGLIALGGAVFLAWRRSLVGLLTLAPVVLWKTSFVVVIATRFFAAPDQFYRIIYLIPTAIALVAGLRCLIERGRFRRFAAPTALAIVLLLALPVNRPWRGRMWSQFNQPDRTYLWLAPAAAWLKENQPPSTGCEYVSDNLSDFVINSLLERPPFGNRHYPIKYPFIVDTPADLAKYTEGKLLCGILAVNPAELPPVARSKAADLTKHWDDWKGDHRALSSDKLIKVGEQLKSQGWKRREVPPFYSLFIPPGK